MTNSRRFAFFCGQLGVMMLARYFFMWLPKFATEVEADEVSKIQVVLFSAATVGAVNMAFRLYDAVTDPLAGVLSDRWVAAGRKRRTLLLFSFAVPSIGLTLCFAPTHAMDAGTRWVLLITGMTVFYTGYTFYGIPYWSLVDDYGGSDVEERRRLSNLLGAGMMVATAVGFVLTPYLVKHLGYGVAAIVVGVPAAILMVLPYFGFPPTEGQISAPADSQDSHTAPVGFGALFSALAHRKYLAVLLLFGGSQMSFTVMTASAPFLAEHLLQGGVGDVPKLLGPLLVVSIPSFLFIPAFSRRVGWETALISSSLALGAVYGGTALLGMSLGPLSPMVTAMILFSLGGPMVAVLLGLEGEAVTACAREAGGESISVYFGAYNLVVKALNGVALWITFVLAGQVAATADAATKVWWTRWMGPVAGGCLAAGVIAYYLVRPANSEIGPTTAEPTPPPPPDPDPTA